MSTFTEWRANIYCDTSPIWIDELCHHGTKGQKWGRRRYQNEDGSLTPAGREHYGIGDTKKGTSKGLFGSKKKKVSDMSDDELRKAIERNKLEKEYRESKSSYSLLSKGIDAAKSIYSQYSENKKAQREQIIRDREVKAKESEALASAKKAEAERLKAEAENKQWTYYTKTRKGRRDHMRQTKAEKAKAKAELKNAQAAKRAKNFLFGDTAQQRMLMNMTMTRINMTFPKWQSANRSAAINKFFDAHKSNTTTVINGGSGKKK